MKVSENHRRRLTSILTGLDEVLCQFERWTTDNRMAGPLYEEKDGLSPAQKRAIREEVEAMREDLIEVKKRLHIGARGESTRGAIVSHCSRLWANLCELEASRLKQYGEVPSRLERYLSPRIERLKEAVIRISEIAQRGVH